MIQTIPTDSPWCLNSPYLGKTLMLPNQLFRLFAVPRAIACDKPLRTYDNP
ncbi:MAG: hypothetical protein RM347_010515 [Nostoc sp. ChiQUE02]|nr:hypothetical protein [Nostoc sp. ChiQUE02]MDZ8229240.1 hypothetical protein [Nostoc sp. ChiQUE02]